MNRILSPLNVASLIFLVVIFTLWDKSTKTERREQRQQEETEYVSYLRSLSDNDILERINSKMPLRNKLWIETTFQKAVFQNDTLVFKGTNVDFKNPFGHGFLSVGASDPLTGSLVLVTKLFEPRIIDYITLNNKGLKFEFTDSKGRPSSQMTVTPQEVRDIYIGHHYESVLSAVPPLRDYLLNNGK